MTIEPLFVSGCVEGVKLGNVTVGNTTAQVGLDVSKACGIIVPGQTWLLIAFIVFMCVVVWCVVGRS